MMKESEKIHKKKINDLKDKSNVLVCYRCMKPVEVIDKENDNRVNINQRLKQKKTQSNGLERFFPMQNIKSSMNKTNSEY